MRAGGGKIKGGGYEREVGAKLSLWLSHGQRKDLICRTVGSGAQFTTAAKKLISAGHAGDLMSQDPLSYELLNQFIIECKFWKNLHLIRFLSKDGELYDALEKVKKEASSVSKGWILVAKQNHQRTILLTSPKLVYTDFHALGLSFHSLFSNSVTLYYLDEFLSVVDPEKFLYPERFLQNNS
jgi:hypothetical protein